MSQDLGTSIENSETPVAAQGATTNPIPAAGSSAKTEGQIGGRRCHLRAFRDDMNGQFYALSQEDRVAFETHRSGIIADFQPQTNRERWLATAIAEDLWRLNRARAIENNIFCMGMSGAIADATNADSPQVLAAVCQARVWLADGKHLQTLALYEQRIRRSIEKNEKQLSELQAPRQAERRQALEEAILIARLALSADENHDPTENLGENRFGFSAPEIVALARRRILLDKAIQYQNSLNPGKTNPAARRPGPTPFPRQTAA